jgi:hypothetical protein
MGQMIIANRLTDGRVVFLAADGRWVEAIDAGALTDADRIAALLERAKQDEACNLVVEPSAIDVQEMNGRRRPSAVREAIRAFGPSVRTDSLGA